MINLSLIKKLTIQEGQDLFSLVKSAEIKRCGHWSGWASKLMTSSISERTNVKLDPGATAALLTHGIIQFHGQAMHSMYLQRWEVCYHLTLVMMQLNRCVSTDEVSTKRPRVSWSAKYPDVYPNSNWNERPYWLMRYAFQNRNFILITINTQSAIQELWLGNWVS